MNKTKAVIITLVLTCLLLGSAVAVLYYSKITTYQASIKTIGDFNIYTNEGCTEELTSYDWGEFINVLEAHGKDLPVWIKSLANVEIEVVWYVSTAGWVPYQFSTYTPNYPEYEWRASAVIDGMTWLPKDSTGAEDASHEFGLVLTQGEVRSAVLTLTTSKSDIAYDPLVYEITFESHDVYP